MVGALKKSESSVSAWPVRKTGFVFSMIDEDLSELVVNTTRT